MMIVVLARVGCRCNHDRRDEQDDQQYQQYQQQQLSPSAFGLGTGNLEDTVQATALGSWPSATPASLHSTDD